MVLGLVYTALLFDWAIVEIGFGVFLIIFDSHFEQVTFPAFRLSWRLTVTKCRDQTLGDSNTT